MNLLDAMRYLVALEQHRHFGRAAAACHITQPALSNALRALESELGTAIVRRGRHYEGLTPEGERVLASARCMLHEQERLRQDLASRAGDPQGALMLAAVPTAIPVAAEFVAWLRHGYPGLRPVLRSLSSPAIEAGLDNLGLDLALGYTARAGSTAPGLQAWPQYEERYFAVMQADTPSLVRGAEVTVRDGADACVRPGEPLRWSEFAERPLVMLTAEMHNRAIVDGAFRQAGRSVRVALETDSVLALLTAVQAGPFGAVLPGALLRSLPGRARVVVRPLVEPDVRTPIGFLGRREGRPSRALEAALAVAVSAPWQARLQWRLQWDVAAPADEIDSWP